MDDNSGCGCGCLTAIIVTVIFWRKLSPVFREFSFDFSVFTDIPEGVKDFLLVLIFLLIVFLPLPEPTPKIKYPDFVDIEQNTETNIDAEPEEELEELKTAEEAMAELEEAIEKLEELEERKVPERKLLYTPRQFTAYQPKNIIEIAPEATAKAETKTEIKPEEAIKDSAVSRKKDYSTNYILALIDDLPDYYGLADAEIIFQKIICRILNAQNFVNTCLAVGNQGTYILTSRDRNVYVIKCKCHKKKNITNKAVQEAYTAKAIYHSKKAIIITNRYFTVSAQAAASATGVVLLGRETLISALTSLQCSDRNYIVSLCKGRFYISHDYSEYEEWPKKISQETFENYINRYIVENDKRGSETYSDSD